MKKRILSLVISIIMLVMPVASLCEETVVNPYAGVLMPFAAGGSYQAGHQLNLNVSLGLQSEMAAQNEAIEGLASLLSRIHLQVSAYDEKGMQRVHAEVKVDPLTLLVADMRMSEDGCIQAMTNLTGNYVLSMPLAALMGEGNAEPKLNVSLKDFDLETEEGLAAFRAIPAADRLAIIGASTAPQLGKPLMGWFLKMQMNRKAPLIANEDTAIEASEKRDAIVKQMIGQVSGRNLLDLVSSVMEVLDGSMSEMQLAVAELLAENGVTRQQAQMIGQMLFASPSAEPVPEDLQAASVAEGEAAALVQVEDVAALFEQLKMFLGLLCENATDNMLGLVVSYNEHGGMTGIDVDLQPISAVLPLAGALEYSDKNSENANAKNVHGELQIAPQKSVVANLDAMTSWDPSGKNQNLINGYADVVDQSSGMSMGAAVEAGLNYSIDTDAAGMGREAFEGGLMLAARMNGEAIPKFGANIKGQTVVDQAGFEATSNVAVNLGEMGMLVVDVKINPSETGNYPFTAFEVIDLSAMDESDMETIMGEVQAHVMAIGVGLTTMPEMMGDVLSALTVLTSVK